MDFYEESLELHEKNRGKIEIKCKVPLDNQKDLSLAYTPGVAEPCRQIQSDPDKAYIYTAKGNTIAVVTDGSAVLGLGNIGANASIPVMEGKAALFKKFADVDAIPICIETQQTDEIISIVKNIASTFGGINLEDIAAPRCFEIEKRLQDELDIPVFHDDQHGTAIITTAALINALKIVKKDIEGIKVAINGSGAAGTAIAEMLLSVGVKDIILCNRKGIISRSNLTEEDPNYLLSLKTNHEQRSGTLGDAVKNADVLIGVSAPKTVTPEMVQSMAADPIVFAMANPEPEIMPEDALAAGARIVGTGRSDYPNQINNVMVFPGIFKGALEAKATKITQEMKIAAAYAIADMIPDTELNESKIVSSIFDDGVSVNVAKAVANAWTL